MTRNVPSSAKCHRASSLGQGYIIVCVNINNAFYCEIDTHESLCVRVAGILEEFNENLLLLSCVDGMCWKDGGWQTLNNEAGEQDGDQSARLALKFMPIPPPSKKKWIAFHAARIATSFVRSTRHRAGFLPCRDDIDKQIPLQDLPPGLTIPVFEFYA